MNENLTNNIVCSNCGTSNVVNAKFCIKCGTSLQPQSVNENQDTNVDYNIEIKSVNDEQNINSVNPNNFQQPLQQQNYNNMNNTYNSQSTNIVGSLNYFSYILGALLKPFDKFKSEENKLNEIKNVSILALIVVGAMTIIRLITTMISAVRVTSFWSNEVKWVWDNLKEVHYFKVIGQSLLIYAGILVTVAGVHFLANLVIKKDAKFVKLLGATTTAFIPFAICSSILSPLFSMIYTPLGICVTVIGLIYSLIILLELINELINIEDANVRIYFHLICLSIIFIGGGLVAYKLILGSLTSSLGSLGSLFS